MLTIGDTFERKYVIRALLGAGGFALVYRAHQPDVGRDVAIKVLRSAEDIGTHPATLLARFQREAKMAAELRSEHNIQLYDFGRSNTGFLYMIFEFVDGDPLDEIIKREGALAPRRVIEILKQLLVGLAEAHQLGILHRDVKPANVMIFERLGKKDRAKLIDYGIAKPMGRKSAEDSASITAEGRVVGTPRYMAPEQILMMGELSPATDVYSLGLVAYEMLAGEGLLGGATHTEVIRRQLSGEVFRVPPSAPAPPGLRRVVDKMLAKSQRDRYQNTEVIIADLDAVDPDEAFETIPPVEDLLEELQSSEHLTLARDTGSAESPATVESKPMNRVSPSEERRMRDGPATVDSRPMARIREAAGAEAAVALTEDLPIDNPTQESSPADLAHKLAGDSADRTGNRGQVAMNPSPSRDISAEILGATTPGKRVAVIFGLIAFGGLVAAVAVIGVVFAVTDLGDRAKNKVSREVESARVAAATDCDDDEYEPNDRSLEGTELTPAADIQGTLCPGDVDWFFLGQHKKGDQVAFGAEYFGDATEHNDIDFEIFVDSHHEKTVFTANPSESVVHTTQHDGRVTARVHFPGTQPKSGRDYRVTRNLASLPDFSETGEDVRVGDAGVGDAGIGDESAGASTE